MQLQKLLRTALVLLIIGMNIGCDQISKSIVREQIASNEQIELINHNLILTNVENSGAFLSLGDKLPMPLKTVLLLLLPGLVLLIAMGIALFHANLPRNARIGLGFIVGGGIGNIFDRFLYGSVTDFMHIDLDLVHTGIFNMADVSIMAGAVLILLQMAIKNKH